MVIWQVFVWLFGILLMWQLADFWCDSWPRKEPFGFPSASVRHGCHCALLFRLPTKASHGTDAGCLDLVIHVRSAGILFRHAHFWQVFPLLLRPYPAFPWGLCRQTELACRESRHSRFAVPSLTNSFWLRIRVCLMASCMRRHYAFLRLSLLECSPLFPHLIVPATPWFPDFAVQR